MASTVGNLAPKGAVKQGGLIGTIDFGTGANAQPSIWYLYVMVYNGVSYLFARHSGDATNTMFRPAHTGLIEGIKNDLGVLKGFVTEASKPESTYTALGITYAADPSKDVLYTDGAGNFKSTPYTDATTTEQVTNLLSQLTGDTTAPTDPTAKKWYQKVWVWIAGGTVLTIGGILIWKNRKK